MFKEHKKLKCIYWKLQGHWIHSTLLIVTINVTAQSSESRHARTHTHTQLWTTTTGPAVCYQRRQSNKAAFWTLTFSSIIRKTAVGRKGKLLPWQLLWSDDVRNAVGKVYGAILAHNHNLLKKRNVITISPYNWVKRNQLDATYFIIYSILIQCSTCFGR